MATGQQSCAKNRFVRRMFRRSTRHEGCGFRAGLGARPVNALLNFMLNFMLNFVLGAFVFNSTVFQMKEI